MAANMIIFAAFTFLPTRCNGLFARSLTWISRHSLTIYLWHLIIIKYVLRPLEVPDLLVFIITLAVCLPLSAVTDLAFAPLRRRLSR